MFGILAEDDSDFQTLKVLVRKLRGPSVTVQGKGYNGCSELLRKGAKAIIALRDTGAVSRFIVCHDADGPDPDVKGAIVQRDVIDPTDLNEHCRLVIPVHELEAWILADLDAVRAVIRTFPKRKPIQSPELISDPKEHLERLSKADNGKYLYNHAIHNERVALYLDLSLVHSKCPSYRPFQEFILG